MRAPALGFLIVGLLLAGCSADWQPQHRAAAIPAEAKQSFVSAGTTLPSPARVSFASLPDRGDLLAYDRDRPIRRGGAYTWHPVELSEAHALGAVVGGELVVTAPNGQPIRLRYERHVEHKDGNWTWIGRAPGSQPGTEAILTFGEKAAFGSIPYGDEEPLRLTIVGGSAWLVETDRRRLALMDNTGTRPRTPDHRVPPRLLQRPKPTSELFSAAQGAEAVVTTDVTAAATTTVDLLLGYTNGFATRLGGQSQANTRLTFLVDVANQAYANSQMSTRLRLVRTQQVTYPDATANETALYNLSGVECTELPNGNLNCTYVGVPAALQPLVTARNQYGADLVSLVRNFNDPENDGCGLAWLLGAGQQPIPTSDADYAISIVSDSSGNMFPDNGFICRDETLAHEAGHNMGSAHDIETSKGEDGVLDAEDYGRYAYSFGHKTAAGGGNFYTIMAYGDSGQTKYRVFSNPLITYCGGLACGVTNQADNAKSLDQTAPVIAAFRATTTTFSDVPPTYWAYDFIESLYDAGITGGCATNPLRYCPENSVLRDQMAVFLLRATRGSAYVPPAATGTYFADVPASHPFAAWIEQVARDGIAGGCATNPARYCPSSAVTREQMAIFLLRSKHGAAYSPPAATGMFSDVPTNYWAARWIEQLAREGITGGCSTNPAKYCPLSPVTRAQMAVFLTRTFNL